MGPYYYYYYAVGPTTAPPAAPTEVSPAPPPIELAPIEVTDTSSTFNLTQFIRGGVTTADLALRFKCAELRVEEGTLVEADGEPADALTIVMRLGEDPGVPNVTLASPVCTIFSPGVERVDFTGPAILYMWYDEVPPGFTAADLVIAYFDEEMGTWVPLPTVVETAYKRAWARVPHFTDFAVVAFEVVPVDPYLSLEVAPRLIAGAESTVVVTVRSPEGAPLGGTAVRLYVNGEYWATSATDIRGRAVFTVVFREPGTYSLYAEAHGYRSNVAVVEVVRPPTLSALRLEVPSNVVMVGDSVPLLIGAYTADGMPLGGVRLEVVVNGDVVGVVTTGENGMAAFSFTPRSPGRYVVRVVSGSVWAETVIEAVEAQTEAREPDDMGQEETTTETGPAEEPPAEEARPTETPVVVAGGDTGGDRDEGAGAGVPIQVEEGAPEASMGQEQPSPLAVGLAVAIVLVALAVGLVVAGKRGLLNLRIPLRR